MTKIKFCGLSRASDIMAANELLPEYVGFVFYKKSRRYITPAKAAELKMLLTGKISAVGVFVNEEIEIVAGLLNDDIIDIAQLHGNEDDTYIEKLKFNTGKPVIKSFKIMNETDIEAAKSSRADYILLDSGAGTGRTFDWSLIKKIKRPYFLAGGLSPGNVERAVAMLNPYAVDVSSGIETDGLKDKTKMAEFMAAVRREG